jgi:hypothetical protein
MTKRLIRLDIAMDRDVPHPIPKFSAVLFEEIEALILRRYGLDAKVSGVYDNIDEVA